MLGGGPRCRPVEQARHVIRANHVGKPPRRSQGRVPVADRHVEHPLVTPQIDRLAQRFADELQRDPHNGVVA